MVYKNVGLPQVSNFKEFAYNEGDAGNMSSIPGSGRSAGGEHSNPLQSSCLRIPWTEEPGGLYIVHGVTESDTTEATEHSTALGEYDWLMSLWFCNIH